MQEKAHMTQCRNKTQLTGSLTVFLALILGMMLAVVFSFLEASRVYGLQANAEMGAMQAADSLLSEYHSGLWEKEGLLFWEARKGNGITDINGAAARQKYYYDHSEATHSAEGLLTGNDYLAISMSRVVVDAYELATDRDGAPFREEAVLAAKAALAENAVEELRELLQESDEQSLSEDDVLQMEEEAGETAKKLEAGVADGTASGGSADETTSAGTAGDTASAGLAGDTASSGEDASEEETDADSQAAAEARKLRKDNPLRWMTKTKKKGILALVMADREISGQRIDLSSTLMRRRRSSGTYETAAATGPADRFWFRLYLQQHFRDASCQPVEGALCYEMEYLLAGKSSDRANLKAAVTRLLLLREGANYAFLLKDAKKSEEAMALATAIASAFGQPELTEPVKHAVLLAWAYAESINDVRVLLAGGKISLMKTEGEWKTRLTQLSKKTAGKNILQGDPVMKQEGSKKGLNYTQYLQILLLATGEKKLSYRAMDLIERKENVKMDHMVARMDCSYLFEAPPLFWRFVSLGDNTFGGFSCQRKETLSYL